jgi:DNA-binding SARP family transcriptional activator
MGVEVLTLGDFDIKKSGASLMENSGRSNKTMELLKFFITYRDKKLLPEYIAENLWHDSSSADPKNALRTQVFRLRKNLDSMGLNGVSDGSEGCLDIIFQNGFYVLNLGENCLVDTVLFEEYIKDADMIRGSNPEEAIEKYEKAIGLYRGQYLEDIADSEWVFTTRNRYHRLYVQSLIRLFELLKAKGRSREIVEHFEKAVCYEPYEEALHIFFLEALLDLKEYKNALSHYNYITGRMYRELAVKPSPVLKGIYSRIAAGDSNIHSVDISALSESFSRDDDKEGALFCDIEYFRTIYNLEERRSIRARSKEYLGLVTISEGSIVGPKDKLKTAAEELKCVLKDSLRKGDVYTQWNSHQMIILLTDVQREALTLIGRRIQKRFSSREKCQSYEVDVSFMPITHDKKPFFA